MNYEEAVAYIEETPKFTKKNSLEHTKECLRRLGNPQEKFKVIHVAGTNGKGSTCASVSYTHLDVYKRQLLCAHRLRKRASGYCWSGSHLYGSI